MVQCFVPDCQHHSENTTYKFYRFPTDPKEKQRWINLIRREDRLPDHNSRVCSYHFKDGVKSNWPTLFKRNEQKLFNFESPIKKRRQMKRKDVPAPDTCDEPTPSTSGAHSERTTLVNQAIIQDLEKKVEHLEKELNYLTTHFSFTAIKDNDELVSLYTGLPSSKLFISLHELCSRFEITYYMGWKVDKIRSQDQLLMTLMKLKRNDPQLDLGVRFGCSRATVHNILLTWIHVLHEILYVGFMSKIPSRVKNQACLPSSFSVFSNCRITLDCTEVRCAIPKSMVQQNLTYSHYKHNNTFKGLVGVAPCGVVTYVSELYPGSVSDKEIVKDSGVLSLMHTGDLILADKGFLIRDLLPPGVALNIPPFLSTGQFTKEQVLITRSIARARIHVERAIRRIKGYTILNFIPSNLRPHVTRVWQVCSALTNLQFPLIKEVAPFYCTDHDD